MSINHGRISSNSHEWETPWDFFNKINNKFHFTLDVCATRQNRKVRNYFSKKEDGLSQDWSGEVIWCNPPYGNEVGYWIEKAYQSSLEGAVVVCLIRSSTDAKYWHRFVMKGAIYFVERRLKFIDNVNGTVWSAPFASSVVVFGKAYNHKNIVKSLRKN